MVVATLLRKFCYAVEQRDGTSFARLFCADAVYHDVFYGAFAGSEQIAALIDDWFYRSATDRGDQGRGPGDLLWDFVERFERKAA